MIPVVTPEEMAAIDRTAPEPVEVLIGRAGGAVARSARRMLGGTYGRRVVVLAGKGNNGNDGREAARRLRAWGTRVLVLDATDRPATVPACDLVIDDGEFLEVGERWAENIVCGFARLGGHPVAVVANQPLALAGSIDADGAEKAARFIMVADSFHLPLVFLSDNPGVLPGSKSEQQAILRKGARMYAAQTLATSPKFEVTLRKAYGFGSMVMGMIPFDGQSAVFAFPGATMGAMGAAAMSRASWRSTASTAAIVAPRWPVWPTMSQIGRAHV